MFVLAFIAPYNHYFVDIGELNYHEVVDLARIVPVRADRKSILAVAETVCEYEWYYHSSHTRANCGIGCEPLSCLFELHAIDNEEGLAPYLTASRELREAILKAWAVRPIRWEGVLTYAEIVRRMSHDFEVTAPKTRFDLIDL